MALPKIGNNAPAFNLKDQDGNNIPHYLPDGKEKNIAQFGLLYTYDQATQVCPTGWRLPTNEEWEALFDFQSPNHAALFNLASHALW